MAKPKLPKWKLATELADLSGAPNYEAKNERREITNLDEVAAALD
jgi:hypothetical protein